MTNPAPTLPARAESLSRKRISVLGATGSIGDSTLRVIAQHPDRFHVVALSAQGNVEKLIALARQFQPEIVAIGDAAHVAELRDALPNVIVVGGSDGICEAASYPADISVCAIVGSAGLLPALAAIAQGSHVAIANKETLVCAGELVLQAALKSGAKLLPVDSEHNAIFQVLATEHRAQVDKITLTASGGPLLHRPIDTLETVTPQEAVAHPRWNMGAKISVDSATMMNKGLELIEAHYLFAMPPEQLDVVIHPESIVHSLVHYTDGSVLAQLGMPDMAIPIGYALSWPERMPLDTPKLDLTELGTLRFQKLDNARFPALNLARAALAAGPSALIALNAANEMAVAAFLAGRISFPHITATVARVLDQTAITPITTIEAVIAADHAARRRADTFLGA